MWSIVEAFEVNKLSTKLACGIKIDLDMYGKVNIFGGLSGSGKSYLCHILRGIKSRDQTISGGFISIDPKQIEVYTKPDEIDYKIRNKLIILDRYALYCRSKKLLKFINSSSNKFILMTNGPLDGLNGRLVRLYTLRYDEGRKLFWSERA